MDIPDIGKRGKCMDSGRKAYCGSNADNACGMQKNSNSNLMKVSDSKELIEYAASVLRDGGVVLTPTDTVYGLLCMPESARAVQMIFEMKQRPFSQRLPIIVASREQAEEVLPVEWNIHAGKLADAFWPGALTIACGLRKNSVDWLSGRDEAAIRVPDFFFVQELARKLGPLLMTSANRHGVETPHTVEGALESLAVRPALALDGGLLSGAPSTLVNVNCPSPVIERLGSIPKTEIERVL